MVSWVITGATRGIGFEFVNNLSNDPQNQVFALIRSLKTAGPLQTLASKRPNIHILVTDLGDATKLAATAAEVSSVTAGSLDVLILNASSPGPETSALMPSAFHGKEDALEREINENMHTNVLSPILTINAFLPLTRASAAKKIIFISSNSGSVSFTRTTRFPNLVGYSAAKAAMMVVMAKYHAELAEQGVYTLSLSPGWVDTDAAKAVTGDPETRKYVLGLFRRLGQEDLQGPAPVGEAVAQMLDVIRGLGEGESGRFLTHRGKDAFVEGVEWF